MSRLDIVTLFFLTFMQSTSCEVLGWMKPKLESRLLGEISITSDDTTICYCYQMTSITSDADDTTLMAESKELKSLLMKMKEESEKVGLKLNI